MEITYVKTEKISYKLSSLMSQTQMPSHTNIESVWYHLQLLITSFQAVTFSHTFKFYVTFFIVAAYPGIPSCLANTTKK